MQINQNAAISTTIAFSDTLLSLSHLVHWTETSASFSPSNRRWLSLSLTLSPQSPPRPQPLLLLLLPLQRCHVNARREPA